MIDFIKNWKRSSKIYVKLFKNSIIYFKLIKNSKIYFKLKNKIVKVS